jgi:hypothetical protein
VGHRTEDAEEDMIHMDPAAVKAYMDSIQARLLATPVEVLQEAKRRQDIEAHNDRVDAAKAAKKATQAQRAMISRLLGVQG